jgi:hypothetical protein
MKIPRKTRRFPFQYVRTALPNAGARKYGNQRLPRGIVYWIAATAWTALAPAAAHLPFAASV